MNPRQRRGVLLLLATALGAVLVFAALALYTRTVASQVGPTTEVVRLTQGVTELQPLTPDLVETVEVPVRWVSDTAFRSVDEIGGLVAAGDFDAGVTLQRGMLREPPGLQPGYREVAIMVDAETGVAGKVTPGDRVDIIATTVDPDTERQRAEIWVSNALVLEVGLPRDAESEDAQGNFTSTRGVPVTFALASADALRLAYAESFATKLRLALRGVGDLEQLPEAESSYTQDMPVRSGALPAGVVPQAIPEPREEEQPPEEEQPREEEPPAAEESPAPEEQPEQPAEEQQPEEQQPADQNEEGEQ